MKLGFISDIHEDIKSLEQALAILESRHCDKLICLGDFVGYSVPFYGFLWSRNAPKVISRIREKCEIIVVGNHDLFAVRKLPNHTAGFLYPPDWYALDYGQRVELAQDKVYLYEDNELSALLSASDKEFIENLPEHVVGTFHGVKILLSHYAYPDLVGTTTFEPKTVQDVKEHFEFMQQFGCRLSISGHDHKEGMMIFTPDKVETHGFGKMRIDDHQPTWLHGPSVVNGTFANGVMVFDTDTYEMEAIPLNSKKHLVPDWS